MNTFSGITNYIIDRFNSDNLVNTIELNDIRIVDRKKESIYPLVSIFYNDLDMNDDAFLSDSFTIYVLQQRDSNRKIKDSKLMIDTNWIDNINECRSIVVKFVNYIRRIDIDNNIEISLSPINHIPEYGANNLDGYTFDITLSMPNTGYCGN